jgi:hypothetical protein
MAQLRVHLKGNIYQRKTIHFWRRISLSNRSASRRGRIAIVSVSPVMSKGTELLNQSVNRIQLQMNTFHLADGREFGEMKDEQKSE